MYEILDKIDSPSDIKVLDMGQLRELCAQIRQYIIEVCSGNPGHLGSSLGSVELIVGMHYVFDTPTDKLLFDVGHQAYAHKILTGRREQFQRNRKADGISGFPRMAESPYDAFGVGHSSTSISAGLGIAEAYKIQGRDAKVAALIGDGALTGGLAFEGLNNAGVSSSDLLVILNDNDHSIDDNQGSLHRYLLRITTSRRYNKFKGRVWDMLGDGRLRLFLQRWTKSLKSWFVKKSGGDFFEALGFRYFGPIDGNDIQQVVLNLRKLYDMRGPRILHAITVKGKGCSYAEADPTQWHAPGLFDPHTGERLAAHYAADRYQDVFGQTLLELAGNDERVVGVTPAMATGCGMSAFAKRFPCRFFDVGIEEEHAVTFSAGLAAAGMRPFCNIYSTFAQRAYDQIIHDVALQRLPVTLYFDRAGLVGEDGATHHGCFDIAAYRSIPDVTIAAPSNELELKRLMYTALQQEHGPFIIRYPRGCGEGVDWKDAAVETLPVGKALELLEGDGVAVVATGPSVNCALEAAKSFPGRIGVYNFLYVKPFDEDMLRRIAGRYKAILTLEDGCMKGGLFGEVCETLQRNGLAVRVHAFGIPDRFMHQAKQSDQRRECGLDSESIRKKLGSLLEAGLV